MSLFISFFILSAVIIITPGPNVLLIVSASIQHGKSHGLKTVAGTSLAMLVQLLLASIGTSWLINFFVNGFYILKWLGVVYLFCLGLLHLRNAITGNDEKEPVTALASFSRGFMVSLTNPKTILFFSSFLPQFISGTGSYLLQITILSFTFLLLAIFFDSMYAILAGKFNMLLARRGYSLLRNGFSGTLYLTASAWLALFKRT